MDRSYIARQLNVAINGEPMLATASDDYKAQMVINWTNHLAGNWEQMELWKIQLATRKAAMEQKEEPPREFVITQRHLPPVKLTPTEYQRYVREYYGETIIEETPNETIIGYWLSKLGIKR